MSRSPAPSPARPDPPPRLSRRSDGKLIAGVASGVGDHFNIEPNLVRLAFVVLALAGGAGVVLYVAGWLWLPEAGRRRRAARPRSSPRGAGGPTGCRSPRSARSCSACCSSRSRSGSGARPVRVAGRARRHGHGVDRRAQRAAHRRADQRAHPSRARRSAADPGERDATAIGRVVIGAALVVSGVAAFLATQGAFAAIGQGLLAVAVVIGGLALIFGPWLWRLWHALVEERSERIRSDERAEMAAHLHDSVLQTLAMIQRQADDPRAVVGLARRQERELRAWLFGRGAGPRRPRSRRRDRRRRRRRRAAPRRTDRGRARGRRVPARRPPARAGARGA